MHRCSSVSVPRGRMLVSILALGRKSLNVIRAIVLNCASVKEATVPCCHCWLFRCFAMVPPAHLILPCPSRPRSDSTRKCFQARKRASRLDRLLQQRVHVHISKTQLSNSAAFGDISSQSSHMSASPGTPMRSEHAGNKRGLPRLQHPHPAAVQHAHQRLQAGRSTTKERYLLDSMAKLGETSGDRPQSKARTHGNRCAPNTRFG